jgi:hypothetical protein
MTQIFEDKMLPDSTFELVEPNGALAFDEWSTFAPYRWFFVCGFVEAWQDLSRHAKRNRKRRLTRVRFAEDYGPRAAEAVLPAWREEWDHEDWDAIAERQFDHAHKNHHVVYAKAVLAISALKLCAKDMGCTSPQLDSLKICPAIYVVDGLNLERWKEIKERGFESDGDNFMTKLKTRTFQRNENVFEELAGNSSCTYHTVRLFIAFLKDCGLAGGLRLQTKTSRDCPLYPSRNGLNPAQFEICQSGRQLAT